MARNDRTPASPVISLLFACGLLVMSACAQEVKPRAMPPDASSESLAARRAMTEHKGIWKWVVPPVRMHGMFDDHDPIGLVAGKLLPADCAFNWTDPDTHKMYCFTTATSLVYFLGSPQTYMAEAARNWRILKGGRAAHR